jgi:dTDP-4-dehydrorhamnose 3,5-epimerase
MTPLLPAQVALTEGGTLARVSWTLGDGARVGRHAGVVGRFVPMRFETTPLDGAWVVELEPKVDDRGFFARSFCAREYAEHGLPTTFPQSNLSRNTTAGTLRGMHFNTSAHEESKVVRCTQGAIHDVIIDLRATSPSYRAWFAIELTATSGRALFVPEGFAHGFLTLVEHTDVEYQMGGFYVAESARGVRWNDPAFGVIWPRDPTVISPRDASYPDFDPAVLSS